MDNRKLHNLVVLVFLGLSILIVSCIGGSSNSTDRKTTSSRSFLQKDNFNLTNVEDLQQLLTYSEDRYPLISAHRGGASSGYPENAIETFQNIANALPIIIECDVRISKDSVLVLMHDETLDRTSTGEGKLSDFTLAELRQFSLKDKEGIETKYKIPTLEEALQWGKGKVIFTLDVKKDVPYSSLLAVIEKTKAKSYVVVITYNANQARTLYNLNPEIMISASIQNEKDFRRLAEIGIPDNKIIAFVGTREANSELVELLHNHGVKTILGTLGNLDKQANSKGYQLYADFVENGADVLSTDYPLEAKKALDYYIRKRKLSSPYINN